MLFYVGRDHHRAALAARGGRARRRLGRVLRPAARVDHGHGRARAGREPDHAVRRARAAVDPALRAVRERGTPRDLARGRAQVPGDRLGRLGDAALRAGADLRRDRPDRLRRDRRRDRGHGLARRPAAAHGHRPGGHRPRLQGVGRAVPPVDAGRLPGRPDPDHELHGGGHQGRCVRGDPATLRPRAGGRPSSTGARRSPRSPSRRS